jgi:hypothetical protein
MPIGVGINDNVIIKAVGFNDKKTLEIELAEVGELVGAKKNVFEESLTASTASAGNAFGFKMRVFPPLLPNKPEQTKEQKIDLATRDIKTLTAKLNHILEQFMTLDKIDINTLDVLYANTGISDMASLESRILDQDVLTKIYDNAVGRFIQLMSPWVNKPEEAVRIKLCRQSKDKHYADFPRYFDAGNPFIELMVVPKEQSKVKFSKYELENGLNDGTPIQAATAEKKEAAVEVNPFAAQ